MKKWLALGIAVAAAAGAIALYATRAQTTYARDAVLDDFRATERQCIAAFNAGLREQRSNAIDEVELAVRIERDALGPWRAMAARVATAPVRDPELHATLKRYIAARQEAWEAYVAALHAASDTDARPAYDRYHARNADADREARALGAMFRRR